MVGLRSRDGTVLMIVDVQESHFPLCRAGEATLDRMVRVAKAAGILEVPTILTEHHPRVFGPTVAPLAEAAGVEPLAKMSFSCLGDPDIVERLERLGAKSVVLIGTETHICVCQTALDALDRGLDVAVVADAVTGRKSLDHDVALSRLRARGVDVLTWESLVYEWMRRGGTDEFRQVLPLVKA